MGLGKEKQATKARRKQEIIMIKVKMNKIQNRKSMEKINDRSIRLIKIQLD